MRMSYDPRVSHAAAFGIGAAMGFTMSVLMAFVLIPRFARRAPGKPAWGRAFTFLGLMFVPPLIGAFLMPDLKAGLLLWIGFPVGYVLAQPLTLPLRYRTRGRR